MPDIICDPEDWEDVIGRDLRKRHRPGRIHKPQIRDDRTLSGGRPFIGIDGEGGGENEHGQQHYKLLCASNADGSVAETLFKNNEPLDADDCFEFILDLPKDAYIVGYYFNYDTTQILRHLPEERLTRLFNAGRNWVNWKGYEIKYLSRHYLKIARSIYPRAGGPSKADPATIRTVYEVGGFFQQKFIKAVSSWEVGTPADRALIAQLKTLRPEFDTIEDLHITYCQAECRLLAQMMTAVRQACFDGENDLAEKLGLNIKIWPRQPGGAGYIAARMHESAGTPKRAVPGKTRRSASLPDLDPELDKAANAAYYGGRFEVSRTGLISHTVYESDINSAYPSGMLELHCPLHTRWEQLSERPTDGSLYLAEVKFSHPDRQLWNALPFRSRQGRLHWPARGRGTYWSCEIEAAEKLFNCDLKTVTVWKTIKCCDCNPYAWVEPIYNYRKSIGKAQKGIVLKLGLNSLYGKLAQRTGAAPFHDTLSAGLITALTRTKLLTATAKNPEAVIMLATDAVYSTEPLDLPIKPDLGCWEAKTHASMFIVQPGLYWFPGEPSSHKTRGTPQSVIQDYAEVFEGLWAKYMTYVEHAIGACYLAVHMQEQGADVPLPDPVAWRNEFPIVPVATPSFISLKLAMARKEKLTAAGRWLRECDDPKCSHEYCGKRFISFDWSNKRRGGVPVESWVQHLPHVGSTSSVSKAYDPILLTTVENQTVMYEGLPDKMEWLPDFTFDFDALEKEGLTGEVEDDSLSLDEIE